MFKLLIYLILFLFPACAFSQTVSFTFLPASNGFCNPANISFTATTSETPIGYTWAFGDGQFSNAANPSNQYLTPGVYTVKLLAVFANQAVETSQDITINPSIALSLTADRNYICQPGNVNFTTTTSGNITSYEWNFGDGTTITNSSSSMSHNYANFNSYTCTVRAIDASGCFATATQNIAVQKPAISGSINPTNGCIPVTSNFTANVTLPTGGSVTSYTWDFNDGSPTSNTGTHTYSAVGTYNPTVNIVTNEGCTNSFSYPSIAFGTPPTNPIAYTDKLVYCGSETPTFVAKANTANSYTWDFGDGTITTVSDTTTTHKYATLGPKVITVTPFFNGCAGATQTLNITIVGVIASFNFSNTCGNKKTFAFVNTSQGNISTSDWSFGDGSANSSTTNTTHTYPPSGSFTTSLNVRDNNTNCSDIAVVVIQTANPTLINPDTFVCRNANTTFTLQNNFQTPGIQYTWNIVGLAPINNTTQPLNIPASAFGTHSNNYVIINNGGQYCPDTIFLNKSISVRGPNLSFTAPTLICANTAFTITNTSAPYLASDSVKLWYWNYGNTVKNDSIYQPPTLQYNAVGTFNIKLVAKDKNGCIDSLSKTITTQRTPFLRVFPRADTLCLGQTDSLFAFHSDTLLWTPSNAVTCTTCDTTFNTANTTGYIYATATNNLNCVARDSVFVLVNTPFTASTSQSPVSVCLGDSIKLDALPLGKKIIWLPNTNISNATIYNPVVFPNVNTIYSAALEDSSGCFTDTVDVNVIVKTLPTVNAGPDLFLPYESPFTISPIYSGNVQSYLWIPSGNCPAPSGIANEAQFFTIKVTSDSGCIATDEIKVFVECKYANIFIPNAFTPNNDGKNDLFKPITRGIKTINSFVIFDRYGKKVYQLNNSIPNQNKIGWNGKFNATDLNPGTYVYLLTVTCDSGELLQKKDSFILIR
jgi:gliding motility-associated-like protein